MKLFNHMWNFLRSTRAGATAMAAAAVVVITVGAVGYISDHRWLVFKRDTFKSAVDAGAIAATFELQNDPYLKDAELKTIARRYVLFNLLDNFDDLEESDVVLTMGIDRANGVVHVRGEAPIGGALFGFLTGGNYEKPMSSKSGVSQSIAPVAVSLAIDVSESMRLNLEGRTAYSEKSRMEVVQESAKVMIDALQPNPTDPVKIAVIPWTTESTCHDGDDCASGTGLSTDSTFVHPHPIVLAPSTLKNEIVASVNSLEPVGRVTYSTSGLLESTKQLRTLDSDLRKAIVLLTDGEDNSYFRNGVQQHCRRKMTPERLWYVADQKCHYPRRSACDDAKANGIEIFVVAAMNTTTIADSFADELEYCASSADHLFINNTDPKDIERAFRNIAVALRPLRRIY